MGALLSTVSGEVSGKPLPDSYGTKTETAGTPILRVIPPAVGLRAVCTGFCHKSGTTAHTVTFLTALAVAEVTEYAESGQAVLKVDELNYNADGSPVANTDYFVVQHIDGSYEPYKFDSNTLLAITFSSNLTKDVAQGAKVFFMGQPSDHAYRQFLGLASGDFPPAGVGGRFATAAKKEQPILVHVDNITAQGWLKYVTYGYVND